MADSSAGPLKIGLALSGGGMRATVFHLGVLRRLAETDLLEQVSVVSTVSGGSMCAALTNAVSGGTWPSSKTFIDTVVPAAWDVLRRVNLSHEVIKRAVPSIILSPGRILGARAEDLAAALDKHWRVTGPVHGMPARPRWVINATCFETAVNWRFTSEWMGDYHFGYSPAPTVPLAQAVASSCAFPGVVGHLEVKTTGRTWYRFREEVDRRELRAGDALDSPRRTVAAKPPYSSVHLYDGGVYDNLGVEALYEPDSGYVDGVDFLIVSDASGAPALRGYPPLWDILSRGRHLLDVATSQSRSLRVRGVIAHFNAKRGSDVGRFVRIGNTPSRIAAQAQRVSEAHALLSGTQSDAEADAARTMKTTIRSVTDAEFERLFRNGFEVADYTLWAWDKTGRHQLHQYPGVL